MDEIFYRRHLDECDVICEETGYLQVLQYSDGQYNTSDQHSLKLGDDFDNFIVRKGTFKAPALPKGTTFASGIRLLLQLNARDPKTFEPGVISLPKEAFDGLVRQFKLPFRNLETSSAVGPLFWWTGKRELSKDCLRKSKYQGFLLAKHILTKATELVFRKSDVEWLGHSRGWMMMLSYSFPTKMTNGYIKATESAKFNETLDLFQDFKEPGSHPLLLPVLALNKELATKNDKMQRDVRAKLRALEEALSQRYQLDPSKSQPSANDHLLDAINRGLADCQCKAMWKRPQAWRNVIDQMADATEFFWQTCSEDEKSQELTEMHHEIRDRLQYLTIKLNALEAYSQVTLERLNVQRQVMDSLINQRESRLNLRIADQQSRLALISRQDSMSMKTLTMLGAFFLPGTFLSSLFSMSFFKFDNGEETTESSSSVAGLCADTPKTAQISTARSLLASGYTLRR
ncbi:uncharacterized protein E0L32_001605 [Thyridium curvatum]|uniref:Uncharacterized protein n=1 Tax=Thyridium curvatum TaxID=1093900 RepID=A0A507AIN9_9PEZI|nr:uncharacterized protein E0L32_001592 [Thyridium curvatum]XP_030990856.1 uncharacterized protein E0L32_001605 [Thyridium curvatum]TPX09132.1 hypothetical protein E0L32_001592 [Thyridium curvatum]TPX09145.1 hypothetical protein E0L32_001605 [Thyridium curvatum]